ncbi:MAG: hypothetical protein ACHQ5A_08930 [Opitutales bacterium]
MKRNALRWLVVASLAWLAGCSDWRFNVVENGVTYARIRVVRDGFRIGELAQDATIGGRACRKGWVHLHANGVPAGFTAAQPFPLGPNTVPAGTWVFQNEAGVVTVCSFPRDIVIQGYPLRCSGGPKGVQTAFYPNGALRQFYPQGRVLVGTIPCRARPFEPGIMLYENGRLRSAVLAADWEIEGKSCRQGELIRLDPNGHLQP